MTDISFLGLQSGQGILGQPMEPKIGGKYMSLTRILKKRSSMKERKGYEFIEGVQV